MSIPNIQLTDFPFAYQDMILDEFEQNQIDYGYDHLPQHKAMCLYELFSCHLLVKVPKNSASIEQLKLTWQHHLANNANHDAFKFSYKNSEELIIQL